MTAREQIQPDDAMAPSMQPYDILYGARADVSVPANLVIDYDVARLNRATGSARRCAELSDLVGGGEGPFRRICMAILPYTSNVQLRRDLAAAARLLHPTGILDARAEERRLLSGIGRELVQHFAVVEKADRLGFRCRKPTPNSEPQDSCDDFSYADALSGRALIFGTRPGLFSPTAVDAGTRLLLDAVAREPDTIRGKRVLDIGCGYGALGCVLAARGAAVTMVDSDWRAVKLARFNLKRNGLDGDVELCDATTTLPKGPFDLIVSNPPTHSGSGMLQRMFGLAVGVGPRFLIVVRAHLNYEKWLEAHHLFECLTRRDGYKVIAISGRL